MNNVKFVRKIAIILLIIALTLLINIPKVEAASFSITSGISTITVGGSYNITINAAGLTGRFNITHSSNVSVNVDSVWVDNGVADSTIKVTTKSAGKATVTLTPDEETRITDANTAEFVTVSPKTDTVTVKAKSTSTNSGSSSTGNSGNSSGSSSGNSGTQQTSTPSFSSVNETVYATTSVNVRSSYSTIRNVVGYLIQGESVTITRKDSNG